nr:hypothetical protein [uncultured Campylobacter sp.]
MGQNFKFYAFRILKFGYVNLCDEISSLKIRAGFGILYVPRQL